MEVAIKNNFSFLARFIFKDELGELPSLTSLFIYEPIFYYEQ